MYEIMRHCEIVSEVGLNSLVSTKHQSQTSLGAQFCLTDKTSLGASPRATKTGQWEWAITARAACRHILIAVTGRRTLQHMAMTP